MVSSTPVVWCDAYICIPGTLDPIHHLDPVHQPCCGEMSLAAATGTSGLPVGRKELVARPSAVIHLHLGTAGL